jgi:hypothetical protein
LLTLAGLEDPSSAPSFQSVVLDQIKHLRKQLDEDEQSAQYKQGGQEEVGGDMGYYGEEEEGGMRYALSEVMGSDGLPQMFVQGERGSAPPLFIQN